jgi:predicted RNase H-like nuclease (RuvC/YqgF family)
MEEKQKILSIAMEGFHKLQSEYEEMAKHRYNEQARQTETVMRNMDSEKQATLKKTTDSKQIQIIEMQHKAKMDELAKQLATFKEKEKQQEMMAKQISMRESKIKNLEDDIGKMRKTTENLEKKLKTEQDKSTEYKITAQKEIS